MSQSPTHRAMRSTGIDWCPEIPEPWTMKQVRHLGFVRSGGTPKPNAENWGGDVPFITPTDLRHFIARPVAETERTLSDEGARTGSTMVPANSVVVSTRAPIGYVARTLRESAFNQGCRAVLPSAEVVPEFVTYALVAAEQELLARGRGTTFMEVSAALFASVKLPVPSLEEQRDIVCFLDRETSRISALINEQELLMLRLRERERALWDSTLLAPDNSVLTSVRRVLERLDRPARPGQDVVTAYRDGVVTLRKNRRETGYTMSMSESGYQGVAVGDLVFHGLDGFAGAVGISDSSGCASPVYHVCRAVGGNDPEYLAILLRQLGLTGYLTAHGNSVRQRSVDFRTWSTLGRVPIRLPDPAAQRAAVMDLRRNSERVSTLIARTKQFISLSRERRTALIRAAVTGQLDLRGEVA